jgi:hypothetical protein
MHWAIGSGGVSSFALAPHRLNWIESILPRSEIGKAGEIHIAALSGRLPTLTLTLICAFHFASFFQRPRFLGGLPIGSLPGGVSQ